MSLDLTGPARLAQTLESVDQLLYELREAEKPRAEWRVGMEHEKIGVPVADPTAQVPYGGPHGIRALLERLAPMDSGGELYGEDGNPIAVLRKDRSITLEPGGQLELSGAPFRSIRPIAEELAGHLGRVREASAPLGLRWLAGGYRPFKTPAEMEWMPKLRYGAMKRTLGPRGRLAPDMMLMSATVQANLDWSDEQDLAEKVRASTSVSPVVTAMFANSPIVNGRESGFSDFRYEVWRHTDPARCGLLEQMTRPDWGYRDYVEWALDVPLLFVRHEGQYLEGSGRTFRQWWQDGRIPQLDQRPTLQDWTVHLTTLFPEVRVKKVLELRGADCVPQAYLPALPALWVGLLYDVPARRAAWELTARWSFPERLAFQADVARRGLRAQGPGGITARDLARDVLRIARDGLRGWSRESGADDSGYLDPLDALVADGRSLADRVLQDFVSANRSPESLIKAWVIA